MKKVILSCALLVAVFNLYGFNQLRVGNPRVTSYTYQGTIEEASLSVHPKGLFMEYGFYLTFSSKGTVWTSKNDTLEVVLNFDLPANAIVYDSWLWIGNNIIRAKILDKWTAKSIYDSIVKRRMDPSILTKQSATQYELRVFPMLGNETRKVKITYLMPTTWNQSNVISGIPTTILNTSKYIPPKFPIFAWSDSTWTNPQVINNNNIGFTLKNDSALGDYHEAIIPPSSYNSNLKIGFNSPVQNGYYFSKHQKGNEGVYQLAFFPSSLVDSSFKKVAILVDYDASNTTITTNDLLLALKNEMLFNLTAGDSFNLIFSNLSIKRYSNSWVSASKTNIEIAFNSLLNPLSSYSNLAALINNGVDFVKTNGNDGKIILISDADQYGESTVANTLINDIVGLMNPMISIYISDYQSISFPYFYIKGQYYYGNEYFYSNLSRITLGSLHRVRDGLDLTEAIDGPFKYSSGSITSFDLYTTLDAGFCYSRFNVSGQSSIAYMNEPILQVGKFIGGFPFKIEISGEYNSQVISKKLDITPDTLNGDSLAAEMWTGQYIKSLESGTQSNNVISEIINVSLKERVLSKYTAFLCLDDTNQICKDCVDESYLTIITEINSEQDSVLIYPNPFTDQLTINVFCSKSNEVKELSVYDITGKLIYAFAVDHLQKGKNVLSWNGSSSIGVNIKAGVYLLTYKTNSYSKTLKVLRQ